MSYAHLIAQQPSQQKPTMVGTITTLAVAVGVFAVLFGGTHQTVTAGEPAVAAPVTQAAVQVDYLPAQFPVHATDLEEHVQAF